MCVFILLSSGNLTVHIKEGFVLSDFLHVYATAKRREHNADTFVNFNPNQGGGSWE